MATTTMRGAWGRWAVALGVLAGMLAGGCARGPARPIEAYSLLGERLERPEFDAEKRKRLEQDLLAARADLAHHPDSESALIWHGRRLAYLGRYNDAIEAYTRGLVRHPNSYRLLRHRGHRFITVRRLADAVKDLSRAAELCRGAPDAIEPDGDPNPSNVARSTDHSNIYYHLGLAHYLRGEFARSELAFAQRQGLEAYNDDMIVSTSYWRYLALRRQGRAAEAAAIVAQVHPSMQILENTSYHKLCLLYAGQVDEHELLPRAGERLEGGIGYGVATFRLLNGDRDGARSLYDAVIREANPYSFGRIAAEAELRRMARPVPGRTSADGSTPE